MPLVPFLAEPSSGPEAPALEAPAEPEELPPLLEVPAAPEIEEKHFPPSDAEEPPPLCEAFEEEPPVSKLGADGERLWRLMAAIAERLQIVPCEYAGGFALMATEAIAGRASDVGNFSVTAEKAFLRPRPAGDGNLGRAEFEAAPSAAIQFMRHLAKAVPALHELHDATIAVYRKPEHAALFPPRLHPGSWALHFTRRLGGQMNWAVAVLFGMTCRILLLQLLRASHDTIRGRQQHIGAYAAMFEELILPRLRTVGDLIELRDRLLGARRLWESQVLTRVYEHQARDLLPPPKPAGPSAAEIAKREWIEARELLLDTLDPAAPATPAAADPRAGEILTDQDGRPEAIRDRDGRPWTIAALERGIPSRRGLLEDLDPIVKQLDDLPDDLVGYRPGHISLRLALLLHEMATANEHQQHLVAESWIYALRISAINRSWRDETVRLSGYALTGIQLAAHKAIGDAFDDDDFYGLAIRAMLHGELGRQGITNFLELGGMTLLAVVYAPLAFVAGVASALHEYQRASERAELYRALIDPEQLITRAEVETELFLARLGVALAVLPGAVTALKIGGSVARVGARYGAAAAARAAPRYAAVLTRAWAEEAQQAMRSGLAVALGRELLTNVVTDAIAERVLAPIAAELQREASLTGATGGSTGAAAVLERLRDEAERRGVQ
jgi:hypothetical protein